jgi:hypothetical protein
MTKVVVANLKSKSKGIGRQKTAVREKRVRDANGRITILRTIDMNSPTFGEDLEYVFKKNVAKARRENKRIIGSADGIAKR